MSKVLGKSLLSDVKPDDCQLVVYESLVESVRERIESGEDRNEICQDILLKFYNEGNDSLKIFKDLSFAEKSRISSYNPKNITLEPEYYNNVDKEKFKKVKPLIWLWIMFDRSPLGRNLYLGIIFRRMLSQFIFKKSADDIKIFHNVEISFGYNIEVGSGTVIHRDVILDDRGGLLIGKNVSISDGVSIFSHSHAVVDIHTITLGKTQIGDGARIMYKSTVLSGVKVGKEGTLGAHALATQDIEDYHICVGIPAKTVRVKAGAKT